MAARLEASSLRRQGEQPRQRELCGNVWRTGESQRHTAHRSAPVGQNLSLGEAGGAEADVRVGGVGDAAVEAGMQARADALPVSLSLSLSLSLGCSAELRFAGSKDYEMAGAQAGASEAGCSPIARARKECGDAYRQVAGSL
jgi:hypothetical protein